MSLLLIPILAAGATALAAHPEATVWVLAWVAAGFGIWLHAVIPPLEGELDAAVLAALSPM